MGDLSAEALQLARATYASAIAHLTEFHATRLISEERIDFEYQRTTGKERLDAEALSAHDIEYDEFAALRNSALSAAESDRKTHDRRLQLINQTAALEEQLGEMVAADPPDYVVNAIGRYPANVGPESASKQDSRWWHDYPETRQALTATRLWTRAAGALVALGDGISLSSTAVETTDELERKASLEARRDYFSSTNQLAAECKKLDITTQHVAEIDLTAASRQRTSLGDASFWMQL